MKFRKLCFISVMFFVCGFFCFVHAGPPNYFKTFKEIEDFLSHSKYDLKYSKELSESAKQKGLNFEECYNLYVEDFQNTRKGSCKNIAVWAKSTLDKANIPNILVGFRNPESESVGHVVNGYIGADGVIYIFDGATFAQHRKDKKKPLYRASLKKYVETYNLKDICVFDKEFNKQIIPNSNNCIGTDMIAYCLREKAQKQIDFLSKGVPENLGSLSNWAFLPNIGSEEQRSELMRLTGLLHYNFNSNPSDTQDDLVQLIFSKVCSFSVV